MLANVNSIFSIAVFMGVTVISTVSRAAFVFNVSQAGNNVYVSGSGTLNLAALTQDATGVDNTRIQPNFNTLVAGPQVTTPMKAYALIAGPANFGAGGYDVPESGTGDLVGVVSRGIEVPQSYVSGSYLSDTGFYFEATFSSLGAAPGTYIYTWGTGPTADSITINIGTVPEPASLSLLSIPAAIALRRPRRFRLASIPIQ